MATIIGSDSRPVETKVLSIDVDQNELPKVLRCLGEKFRINHFEIHPLQSSRSDRNPFNVHVSLPAEEYDWVLGELKKRVIIHKA